MVSEANIRETAAALQLSVGLFKRRARETAREGDLTSPELSVLSRLDQGSYGRCEQCGRPIAPARLAARPAARTCIRCASA